MNAFMQGQYENALNEWLPLAEQGDALAQTGMGFLYAEGLGVEEDDKEAIRWFSLAAEQGYAMAQSFLGQGTWKA